MAQFFNLPSFDTSVVNSTFDGIKTFNNEIINSKSQITPLVFVSAAKELLKNDAVTRVDDLKGNLFTFNDGMKDQLQNALSAIKGAWYWMWMAERMKMDFDFQVATGGIIDPVEIATLNSKLNVSNILKTSIISNADIFKMFVDGELFISVKNKYIQSIELSNPNMPELEFTTSLYQALNSFYVDLIPFRRATELSILDFDTIISNLESELSIKQSENEGNSEILESLMTEYNLFVSYYQNKKELYLEQLNRMNILIDGIEGQMVMKDYDFTGFMYAKYSSLGETELADLYLEIYNLKMDLNNIKNVTIPAIKGDININNAARTVAQNTTNIANGQSIIEIEITPKIEICESEISDLQTTILSLESDISTLQSQIDVLDPQSVTYETDLTNLNSQKTSKESELVSNNTTLSEKQVSLVELNNWMSSINNSMVELQTEMETAIVNQLLETKISTDIEAQLYKSIHLKQQQIDSLLQSKGY